MLQYRLNILETIQNRLFKIQIRCNRDRDSYIFKNNPNDFFQIFYTDTIASLNCFGSFTPTKFMCFQYYDMG